MMPSLRPCICFPTNRYRLLWDLAGALLIFYDLFTLPMEAFKLPKSGFWTGMDWFILLFWTLCLGIHVIGWTMT